MVELERNAAEEERSETVCSAFCCGAELLRFAVVDAAIDASLFKLIKFWVCCYAPVTAGLIDSYDDVLCAPA